MIISYSDGGDIKVSTLIIFYSDGVISRLIKVQSGSGLPFQDVVRAAIARVRKLGMRKSVQELLPC